MARNRAGGGPLIGRPRPTADRTDSGAEVVETSAFRALLLVIGLFPRLWHFVTAAGQKPVEKIVVDPGRHTWYAMAYHHLTLLLYLARQNERLFKRRSELIGGGRSSSKGKRYARTGPTSSISNGPGCHAINRDLSARASENKLVMPPCVHEPTGARLCVAIARISPTLDRFLEKTATTRSADESHQ